MAYQPITWRNVPGSSNMDASLMFRTAGQQLNTGLSDFANIIKGAEATQANNVKVADEVGKQNYLDILQTAKTPEELAALQADPATAAARAGLSASARNATRGAEDARLTSLRTSETAQTAFNNQRLDEAEKPFKDELAALALTNPEAARAKALEYQQNGTLRSVAPVLKDATAAERDNFRWGRTQLEADQADADRRRLLEVTRPQQDASAARAAETADLSLAELKRTTAEKEEARTLDAAFAARAAEHYKTQGENQAEIAKQAKVFGMGAGDVKLSKPIPFKADGTVDYGSMSEEDYAKFDLYLSRANKPTMTAVRTSDTNAFQAAMDEARQGGASAANLARLATTGPIAFNNAKPTRIGNDAEVAARDQRDIAAQDQRLTELYGQINTQGARDDLEKVGREFIDKMPSPKLGNRESWYRGLNKWLNETGGVVVDPKTGEKVFPSASRLREMLGRVNTNMNMFSTETDITDELSDRWDNNKEAQIGAKKLLAAKLTNRLREVEQPSSKK